VSTWIKPTEVGTEVNVHIQPGAAKSEIAGMHGDAIKIRIKARPVEGAANAALIEFIATNLGVTRKAVRILRGEKSRQKTVFIAVRADEVERRLMGKMG
jgi:uncharacterized protein (TIGR00251 family)